MAQETLILAQSLDFFAQGIVLLIGLLLFLLFGGTLLVVLYIGLRVWIFRARQRRARREYLKRTRRADGKHYPPQTGGVCDQCGRVKRVVYFLPAGEKLCHDCYEAWWPVAEGRSGQAEVRADRAAAAPQNRPARSGGRRPEHA